MIDISILPVYLTAVVALLLLPGPDMLLIASSSISYGRKVGVFASLGNATSGIILTLLASLGVSALIAMTFSLIGEELFFRGIVHSSFANSIGNRKASLIDSSFSDFEMAAW